MFFLVVGRVSKAIARGGDVYTILPLGSRLILTVTYTISIFILRRDGCIPKWIRDGKGTVRNTLVREQWKHEFKTARIYLYFMWEDIGRAGKILCS